MPLEPGARTGRHCHHGQLLVVVEQGELTRYADAYHGGVHVYRAGDSVVKGSRYIHETGNERSEDLVVMITHFTPEGRSTEENGPCAVWAIGSRWASGPRRRPFPSQPPAAAYLPTALTFPLSRTTCAGDTGSRTRTPAPRVDRQRLPRRHQQRPHVGPRGQAGHCQLTHGALDVAHPGRALYSDARLANPCRRGVPDVGRRPAAGVYRHGGHRRPPVTDRPRHLSTAATTPARSWN
ncbi:cupin domain-containing protein [Dietzia sp. WMMA184]|uniref:cupin domain-containing protein n=1 Tax=Dietzia sp. WMMA184 TaxID=2039808 RepID=UPI00352E0CBB